MANSVTHVACVFCFGVSIVGIVVEAVSVEASIREHPVNAAKSNGAGPIVRSPLPTANPLKVDDGGRPLAPGAELLADSSQTDASLTPGEATTVATPAERSASSEESEHEHVAKPQPVANEFDSGGRPVPPRSLMRSELQINSRVQQYPPVRTGPTQGQMRPSGAVPVGGRASPYGQPPATPQRMVSDTSGCHVPMWKAKDFVCEEAKGSSKMITKWEDSNGNTRKLMKDRAECTLVCPTSSMVTLPILKDWTYTWLEPDVKSMVCKGGEWESDAGKEMAGISCRTSKKVYLFFGSVTFIFALMGYYIVQARRRKREAQIDLAMASLDADEDLPIDAHGEEPLPDGDATAAEKPAEKPKQAGDAF